MAVKGFITLCPAGQTNLRKNLANYNIFEKVKVGSCPYLQLLGKAEDYTKGINTLAYKTGMQVTTKKSFEPLSPDLGREDLTLTKKSERR